MSDAKRIKMYAIVAAIGIGILAVTLTGGLYSAKVQTANGNSIVTSNDNCLPRGKIHGIDSVGKSSGEQGITSTVSGKETSDNFFALS